MFDLLTNLDVGFEFDIIGHRLFLADWLIYEVTGTV